jgi:hypothetical protein
MVEAARWIRKPGLRAKADKEGDIFLGPWSLITENYGYCLTRFLE